MRQIAFRIWDKEKGCYQESGSTPSMLSLFFTQTAVLNTRDGMPYEQYTGIDDKDGKKIFEGDWVKAWYDDPLDGRDVIGIVMYDETSARWNLDFPDKGASVALYGFDIVDAKIIGNIHDEPELVEVEL